MHHDPRKFARHRVLASRRYRLRSTAIFLLMILIVAACGGEVVDQPPDDVTVVPPDDVTVEPPPDDGQPKITAIEPDVGVPGTVVLVRLEGVGPFREGVYEIFFNDVLGTMVEPLINEEAGDGTIDGLYVIIPPQATSGEVLLRIPERDNPAEQIELRADYEIEALDLADEERSAEFSSQAAGVVFHRLPTSNFVSEVADSKDVGIADFDGDGDLDAFIPQTNNFDDTLYTYTGNDGVGDPRYTISTGIVTNDVAPKRQYGAAVADIDADGDFDVMPSGASPQSDSHRVRLLMNDGSANFTDTHSSNISGLAPITGAMYSWDDAKLADMDGDGDLDIAMANRAAGANAGGRSALLMQDGLNTGNFTAVPDAFGEPANEVHHDVILCDFNNDGLPDVALSQDMRGAQSPLRVLINEGGSTPTFTDISSQLSPNPAAHTEHLGCADFNNDGLLDIHAGVWARSDRDAMTERSREDMIFLNASTDSDGSGDIEASEVVMNLVANPEPGAPRFVGFDAMTYSGSYGDFDNDGNMDILLGPVAPDPLKKGPYVMMGDGTGVFNDIATLNNYWRDLSNTGFDHFNPTSPNVADLNGDGLLDIIWAMGDGMNGPTSEANRIYIQGEIEDPCGRFVIIFDLCRIIDVGHLFPGGLVVEFIEPVLIDPIPRNCLVKFECPGCGGPFELCPNFYNFMFDFSQTQVDPDLIRISLIDINGERIAEATLLDDGVKVISYQPTWFREGGLDQEVAIMFELLEGERLEPFELPVSLEITEEPLGEIGQRG